MRILWLRSEAAFLQIVAFFCLSFAIAQADTSTTANGSSEKVSSLSSRNDSIASTTKSAPVEPAHAQITKVEPMYGPVSGGTKVSIFGQDLACPIDHRMIVHLNFGGTHHTALNCTRETDVITCVTPPWGSPVTVEVEVSCDNIENNISLWKTDSLVIFTYKPDLSITDVYPKESILAGGITQTVIGRNLDSVAHPLMWTGFNPPATGQGQACIVLNSTMLTCRTQSIDAPRSSSSNDSVRTHPDEISFNEGNVQIGFFLDGITGFQWSLRMFHNPEIDKFDPETKDHLAFADEVLSIGVTWPQMNFTPSDLTVLVGIRTCTGVELHERLITCHPPPLPKSVIRYGPSELNTLQVSVSVGHMTRDVIGRLRYMQVESFHVVMSVMIAILAFIFVVSCSCGCCVLCDLQAKGCKGKSKSSQFRPVSDARESTVDGSSGGGRKRRDKRGGTDAAEREGPIECVAMQYRGDGKQPL